MSRETAEKKAGDLFIIVSFLILLVVPCTFLGLGLDKKDYFFANATVSKPVPVGTFQQECVNTNALSCNLVYTSSSKTGSCRGEPYNCCTTDENGVYCSEAVFNSYLYTAYIGVSITFDLTKGKSSEVFHWKTDVFPVADTDKEKYSRLNKTFSMYSWNGPSFEYNSTLINWMIALTVFFGFIFIGSIFSLLGTLYKTRETRVDYEMTVLVEDTN